MRTALLFLCRYLLRAFHNVREGLQLQALRRCNGRCWHVGHPHAKNKDTSACPVDTSAYSDFTLTRGFSILECVSNPLPNAIQNEVVA